MLQRIILVTLVAASVLTSAIGCATQPKPTSAQSDESQAASLGEFRSETLDEYLGSVVVVNFWAIWCAPCRAEVPALETAHRRYRDQGVVILTVNVSEGSSEILSFAQKQGLTLPLLRDSQQRAMKTYDVSMLPTTLFIDRQGKTRLRQVGAMSEAFIERQIESLLEQ
jgi:thiol-disulfide isomerase/thioredoxin